MGDNSKDKPTIIAQVTAVFLKMPDGRGVLNVDGFSSILPNALQQIAAIQNTIIGHFMKEASQGRVDACSMTIVPKQILQQDKRIVDATGTPVGKH